MMFVMFNIGSYQGEYSIKENKLHTINVKTEKDRTFTSTTKVDRNTKMTYNWCNDLLNCEIFWDAGNLKSTTTWSKNEINAKKKT